MHRLEALRYREQCLEFCVWKIDNLLDIVRDLQTKIESFHSTLDCLIAH